jgi:hypothetical protein
MSTEITEQNNSQLNTVNSANNLIMDVQAMNHMMNVATFMAGGTATLPVPYQKNPANCLAVVMQAAQWGMNPFSVAQKTFFINGTIGYEAQLVAAVINSCGAVKDTFHFEWYGDWTRILGKFKEIISTKKLDDNGVGKKFKYPDWNMADEVGLGIKVWATLKGEEEPRILDLLLVQANTRNSTLWADDPRQQLAYLAQKRWARLYAPAAILGVYTNDELEDIPQKEVEINPASKTGAQAAKDAQKGKTIDAAEESRRDGLIKLLNEIASKEGLISYGESWLALKKEERTLIGVEEHERFKSIAVAYDEANKTVHQEAQQQAEVSQSNADFVSEMNAAENTNG